MNRNDSLRKNKLNIFFIAVKVLLCFALLIGGTYALFTDSDEKNVFVTAGNLKMELSTVDVYGNTTDIAGGRSNIFGEEDWEPGQTRVVFFKVKSLSDIRAKYTLNLVVSDDQLEGALEYCAFEGGPADFSGMTWESLTSPRSAKYLVMGQNPVSGATFVEIDPNEEHFYTLFIHMRESASDYQNKAIDLNVHLYATQGNAILE